MDEIFEPVWLEAVVNEATGIGIAVKILTSLFIFKHVITSRRHINYIPHFSIQIAMACRKQS